MLKYLLLTPQQISCSYCDRTSLESTIQQCNRLHDVPFAQKIDLGWLIDADVCLSGAYMSYAVNTFKTCLLDNGRPSHLFPCNNVVSVKEDCSHGFKHSSPPASEDVLNPYASQESHLGNTVFQRNERDRQLAPVIEDKVFLQLIDRRFHKDDTRCLVAPLSFHKPRKCLPNNRQYAFQLFMSLRRNLERKPSMEDDFLELMQGLLDNHHAELTPPLEEGKGVYYLPLFSVYHPQKTGNVIVCVLSFLMCFPPPLCFLLFPVCLCLCVALCKLLLINSCCQSACTSESHPLINSSSINTLAL